MDSFFGIGLPELVFILLLSGIVMGPHRIRQVAHTIGRTTAQLQRVSRQFARQLNAELDAIDDSTVRDSLKDMRELQREVQELRRELGNVPKSLSKQGQGLVNETETALKEPSSTLVKDATAAKDGSANKLGAPEPSNQASNPESPTPTILPKALDVPGDSD